jgi:hypothetical protein
LVKKKAGFLSCRDGDEELETIFSQKNLWLRRAPYPSRIGEVFPTKVNACEGEILGEKAQEGGSEPFSAGGA